MNNRKKYNLNTYFYIKNAKIKKVVIALVGIINIRELEGMFYGCISLISLPDISKWNKINLVENEWFILQTLITTIIRQ